MVDGKAHILSVGDQLKICPGQKHQVRNDSSSEELELYVSCKLSWIYEDCHVISNERTQETIQEKRRSMDLK